MTIKDKLYIVTMNSKLLPNNYGKQGYFWYKKSAEQFIERQLQARYRMTVLPIYSILEYELKEVE